MPSSQQLKPRTALFQFGEALDLPNLTTAAWRNRIAGALALLHLLRAAYPAMQRAARDILTYRKAGPLNEYCASSHDLLSLFPEPDVCSQRAS